MLNSITIRHFKSVVKRSAKAMGYAFPVRGFQLGTDIPGELRRLDIRRIHYGSGPHLKNGWLNADLPEGFPTACNERPYISLDLTARHPFPDNFFEYGFCEDMMEHLSQADSILFLTEAYRTLKPGGVLRLSFPGLRGVLKKHYTDASFTCAQQAKVEAYTMWGHVHFYSEESLELVARHIGFRDFQSVAYGQSQHPALNGLDTRELQIDLNLRAELTK